MTKQHDTSTPPAVEVTGLSKNYGSVAAVRDVNLSIESGEYFVLLGPSGGGKTTLLRLIGGFIRPTAGSVKLHGHEVSHLPPERRPTSMVFQNYALFPHMTVAKNVGYGLRLKKMPKAEQADRVESVLEMVGLAGYDDRMPHELSGGQQQRVQLARAFVLDRDILLLDEPLASLDAKLRKDMCLELKHLQEQVGITFIHVTHNQEEAMTVADRIAIIASGDVIESGTAREMYEAPKRRFTAEFIGENNLFDGAVTAINGDTATLELANGTVDIRLRGEHVEVGANAAISVRSELLELMSSADSRPDGYQMISGTYRESVYLGLTTSHIVALAGGQEIAVRNISGAGVAVELEPGAPVQIGWQTEIARLHAN